MPEQMLDGDQLVVVVLNGIIVLVQQAEWPEDGRHQRKSAPLFEEHDSRGGYQFGDGSQAEDVAL